MWINQTLCGAVFLAAAFAGPAAGDDVRDVLIVDEGGPHVWIALDAMPESLSAQAEPGRLTLLLEGFSPERSRAIRPAGESALSAISLSPHADGARLIIEGRFQTAHAALRQGGVWIALDNTLGDAAQPLDPGAAAQSGEPAMEPERDSPAQPGNATSVRPGAEGDSVEPETSASQGSADDIAAPAAPTGGDAGDAAQAGPPETRVEMSGPCDATAAAVQASPWDLDALTRHADCLVEIEARANAAGLYERVLAFEPTHYRAAIGLARIREYQGRSQDAAALYERAANAAMTDGEALDARAAANRNRD